MELHLEERVFLDLDFRKGINTQYIWVPHFRIEGFLEGGIQELFREGEGASHTCSSAGP